MGYSEYSHGVLCRSFMRSSSATRPASCATCPSCARRSSRRASCALCLATAIRARSSPLQHVPAYCCNSAHAHKTELWAHSCIQSAALVNCSQCNAEARQAARVAAAERRRPASPLSAGAPPQVRVECEEVAAQDAAGRLGDGGGPAGLRGDGDADGSYERHRSTALPFAAKPTRC